MVRDASQDHDRAKSAIGAALLHFLIGYALIVGLGVEIRSGDDEELKLFDVRLPPPTPLIEAEPAVASDGPEGAASPPNLKARASPVVAPETRIELEQPPPLAAAPTPAEGSEAAAGASDRTGSGKGSGGAGTGTGSGRGGEGSGGGGGAAKARLLRGRILDSDYPRAASRAGATGTVTARFTVDTDGRPIGCRVTVSSGNAELDDTTCALIERRFRYEPARDGRGRPVPTAMGWKQSWWQEPRRR